MLSDELINKARRLVEVGFTERRGQLPLELAAIDSQALAAGAYHSGTRLLLIHRVLARELDVRAILTWRSIVRVHQTLGIPADEGLATDLKQLFSGFLGSIRTELDALLRTDEQTEPNLRDRLTLDEACEDSRRKHDVEIDLYVDSLKISAGAQPSAMAHSYHFYGTVGTVQTGPGATANVVQNLAAEDKQALLGALDQIKDAISSSQDLLAQQQELIEIAKECTTLIQAPQPNNSKLRAMFDVLATSVQTLASAQPAYQALKAALVPLGIMLP